MTVRHDDPATWPAYARAEAAYLAGRLRLRPADPRRDDLDQEALWGTWEAAGRFDPGRRVPFDVFARPRTRGRMIDWWRYHSDGGPAARTDASRVGVRADTNSFRYGSAVRVDDLLSELPEPADHRPGPAAEVDAADELDYVLGTVDSRIQVVYRTLLVGGTLEQAGAVLGLSRSRASQLKTRNWPLLTAAAAGTRPPPPDRVPCPVCRRPVPPVANGRPKRYCSPDCKLAAARTLYAAKRSLTPEVA